MTPLVWMLYIAATTALIAGAAIAADRLAEIWNAPRRVIWIAALVLVVAAPIVASRFPRVVTVPQATEARVALSFRGARAERPVDAATLAPSLGVVARSDWNRAALVGWAALSVVMLGIFLRGVYDVARRRRTWTASQLDGVQVLVAEDAGPAVVGMFRPAIVLPSWALTLGADARALMLRHEAEHVAAGDQRSLIAAALVLVAFPWNPALWLIVRRLRLAIEIDCDARVLRHLDRPREYGLLLLSVGERRASVLPLAAALAERQSLLEQRILAMTALRPPRPVLASLPFAAIVAVSVVAAAQTPRPAAAPATPAAPVTPAAAPAAPAMPAAPATAPRAALAPATPGVPIKPADVGGPVAPTLAAAPVSPEEPDIPLEVLKQWIAKYHPTVLQGDTSIKAIAIVVDAYDRYVKSAAGDLAAPRFTSSSLSDLDPSKIESVEVLKGAAAVATYGDVAANGIVIVKTKTGDADAAKVSPAAQDSVVVLTQRQIREAANPQMPVFIVDGIALERPAAGKINAIDRLGVPADAIESMVVRKMRAGVVGPNPLTLLVARLK